MHEELNLWLAAGALVLGVFFGVVCQRSRFCLVAGLSNLVLMRDYRQLHAYLAALALALVGTGLLEWGQWVDVAASHYRNASLDWLGALGGGLIFGIGAMLAGGCATRTLIRTAEGNIGALVTLMAFGLAGMAALFGILEPPRGWLAQSTSLSLDPTSTTIAGLLKLPEAIVSVGLALVCVLTIVRLGDWSDHRGLVASGASIGATVALGWWLTGFVGQDEFSDAAPVSVSIAGPLSRGLAYLTFDQISGTGFGLFFVLGVMSGAFASALTGGEFRWTAPAGNRLGAYLSGGALMGIGAMMAGGCNIGQGITGLATLAVQSCIATVGMLLGMLLVLWRMQRAT